ncbi:hypothetical protein FH972_021883 [Carpinus fangiana]|uniref:Uncharacterized protein n=1 Tax=Carpinus fangiana TaxID=176857 RepID=A0A5N6KR59_9ROSI|nr:hypothetical protein FH972_021883 [Carpinus fangiana]
MLIITEDEALHGLAGTRSRHVGPPNDWVSDGAQLEGDQAANQDLSSYSAGRPFVRPVTRTMYRYSRLSMLNGTSYAEDQPLPKLILTSHVLHRGFQAGAFVGLLVGTARPSVSFLLTSSASRTQNVSSPGSPKLAPTNPSPQTPRVKLLPSTNSLLKGSARGAITGTAFLSVGLTARMWGREEVEWADRSWRLLHNEGQVEVDDWSFIATAFGALFGATRVGPKIMMTIGGAALGNVAGVVGYMGWRYGMMGGSR